MIVVLGALAGLIAGSFVGTLAVRWPEGRGVGGRSACDGCGAVLGPRDLVPLVSWLARRGRCATCGAAIDARHPVAEVACAIVGASALMAAPWSVADQGIRNVSHGCINMPPDDAQWFYDTFSYGDIVQVTGTSTQLAPDDGYGDWNLSWDQWQQGSALL